MLRFICFRGRLAASTSHLAACPPALPPPRSFSTTSHSRSAKQARKPWKKGKQKNGKTKRRHAKVSQAESNATFIPNDVAKWPAPEDTQGGAPASQQTERGQEEPVNGATPSPAKHEAGAGTWRSLRSALRSNPAKVAGFPPNLSGEPVARGIKDAAQEVSSWRPEKDGGSSRKPASSTAKKTMAKVPLDVKIIRPRQLKLCPIEEGPSNVPQLAHNLDRVLFNPGVYHIQDHRSGVFNFDPSLATIMPVAEFDYSALSEYITSSEDVKLRQLSAKHSKKYCGSTSSMTSILSHFHFLLSAWREPTFDNLTRSLEPESTRFTALSRGPAAAFARYQDGVYALDSSKEYDTDNILSLLGRSMEKFFTLPTEEFERYRRTKSHQIPKQERNAEESYHYTTLGDFMMRSQLDAHDPRLPGSGMFDLKTRAVVSIRMDVEGYEKGVGYEIRKRFGQWESFEREYYDMIRAAFLKYSLQVRMGRMDGIFVAFHNTQRIFGFQYIPLSEMDHAIHGTPDLRLGDQEFMCSVALLNDLMDRATERFPKRTLRLHVETRPTKVPLTYFFVEPVTEEEMRRTQEAGKPSVEQVKREIIGLSREVSEAKSAQEEANAQAAAQQAQSDETDKVAAEATPSDPQNDAAWKELMAMVDDSVENESLGISSVKEAVQDALEQSGLLSDKTEVQSEKYVDDMVAALTAHSSAIKEAGEAAEARDATEGGGRATESSGQETETATASLTNLILRVTEGIDDKLSNLKTFERKFADLVTQAKKAEVAGGEQPVKDEDEPGEESTELDSAVEEVDKDGEEPEEQDREILGMYVTIRNRVNGTFVERPSSPEDKFDWSVQYAITELPDHRAQHIYRSIMKRRKEVLGSDPEARAANWHRMFKGTLPIMAKKGEEYRAMRTKQEAGNPVHVAWDKKPLSYEATRAETAAGNE
ncbi:hypothetical protein JDV02_005047 [Purpureocillium takamizusanense]|uniref:Uncharacterized protein n=1 Tax=Purpureocillium takamizusanense TaxID=2060973 RepID=A0A9Q8VBE1_9HYPO|nr:uncharacterized protein JDV02_005047 [Purpureocillium takamizusanense]UNI18799.1 hypothetical protein JDV02_005047 [Purpureocillium takamizusanense]